MKRAFLVYGAESSGCRFVTSAFIACGCDGQATHRQRFDKSLAGAAELIVWRRSFPHNHRWPDIADMVQRLRANGHQDTTVIVTIRDNFAMLESQLLRKHVRSREEGQQNIREAYRLIFSEAHRLHLPVRLAVYEAYVHNPRALESLLASCSLELKAPLQIRDEDGKYFQAADGVGVT